MFIMRKAHAPGDQALRVTSVRDGREHLVAQEAMTPGSSGRYPALCGHQVWAAALACPAGLPCPACSTVGTPYPARERRRHRRRRTGSWTWLARLRRRSRATKAPSVRATEWGNTEVREVRHGR
ncbi:MAG: hypothetical protein ACRDTT_14635 [Pseudonocardiaceae bacterium]